MLALGACIAFLDTCSLATQVAEIIELCTADFTAANHVDVIDHGCVQRENTLDTDAEADLADCDGFANAAVFDGDADAFECLQAFLVAFLDTDADAKRVAWLKCWYVVFELSLFNKI